MVCPECRAEYREGVHRCAHCGIDLVETLGESGDEPRGGESGNLVTVLRTTDPGLLPIARTVLEAAGIPFVVQGEAGLSYFPLGAAAARTTGRVTGASILVPAERAEEARELLESPSEPSESD